MSIKVCVLLCVATLSAHRGVTALKLDSISRLMKESSVSHAAASPQLQRTAPIPAEPTVTPQAVPMNKTAEIFGKLSTGNDNYVVDATAITVILGSRVLEVVLPQEIVASLRAHGHVGVNVHEQSELVRNLQQSMGSTTTYSKRGLEELLPIAEIVRQTHIELIAEVQPGPEDAHAASQLLRHLYFDVKPTDDVHAVAQQACLEMGQAASEQCLDFVRSEVMRVLSASMSALGAHVDPKLAFTSKAYYSSTVLPYCVLLREQFDAEKAALKAVASPASRFTTSSTFSDNLTQSNQGSLNNDESVVSGKFGCNLAVLIDAHNLS